VRLQLQQIRQQQETIRTLFSPIIQIWPQVLALPIVGELDRDRAAETTEQLLQAIVSARCQFVIIDITGVKTVDAVATEQLLKMHRASRLLGAECLLSGISPQVAGFIAQTGSDLSDLGSFRTLESALRHAFSRLGSAGKGPGSRP
jgi:rsbT co-antagonist protein RsbR